MESQGDQLRDFSAWSGEIVNLADWMHIAAVNDPSDRSLTMYVNGVPVQRNVKDALGVGNDGGLPWVLGAGSYAGQLQSGFLGCLGETRLVDHALDQSEWLISRVLPDPTEEPTQPTEEPTDEPTAAPTDEPTDEPTQAATRFVPSAPYTLAGLHKNLNGRDWNTTCEKYSQTERCRTDIWATVVKIVDGRFVRETGWAFNNLTYLPYMTRAAWGQNPLAVTGGWKAETDGRNWRTGCDTPATGGNGCRTYAEVRQVGVR